jgi:hypothetical protein
VPGVPGPRPPRHWGLRIRPGRGLSLPAAQLVLPHGRRVEEAPGGKLWRATPTSCARTCPSSTPGPLRTRPMNRTHGRNGESPSSGCCGSSLFRCCSGRLHGGLAGYDPLRCRACPPGLNSPTFAAATRSVAGIEPGRPCGPGLRRGPRPACWRPKRPSRRTRDTRD